MSLSFGKALAFFDPSSHGVTADTESALKTSGAGAFLVGVEDDGFFCVAVTAFSGVFAVLFVAVEAVVALPAVVGVAVAFEAVALAVRAGQGDRDGHENILQ